MGETERHLLSVSYLEQILNNHMGKISDVYHKYVTKSICRERMAQGYTHPTSYILHLFWIFKCFHIHSLFNYFLLCISEKAF